MSEMRTQVLPLLESLGVDLVLSGHSHVYERSMLIDGHYGLSDSFNSSMIINGKSGRSDTDGAYIKPESQGSNQGTVYAVVGSSASVGSGTLDHPVMYESKGRLGSMLIEIDGSRLDAVFLSDNGSVLDYFAIDKSNDFVIDNPPIFSSTPVSVAMQGRTYEYRIEAFDPDGRNSVQFSAAKLPDWLTLADGGDGFAILTGLPLAADVGEHSVEVIVQELGTVGLSSSQSFRIAVEPAVDEIPLITLIGPSTVRQLIGDHYVEQGAVATDAEDGDITARIVITGSVDTSTAGTYVITYTVQDSGGNSATATREVIVELATTPATRPSESGSGSIAIIELSGLIVVTLLRIFGARKPYSYAVGEVLEERLVSLRTDGRTIQMAAPTLTPNALRKYSRFRRAGATTRPYRLPLAGNWRLILKLTWTS